MNNKVHRNWIEFGASFLSFFQTAKWKGEELKVVDKKKNVIKFCAFNQVEYKYIQIITVHQNKRRNEVLKREIVKNSTLQPKNWK